MATKMRLYLVLILLAVVSGTGCGHSEQKQKRAEIMELRKELYNKNSTLSSYEVGEKAIGLFRDYAKRYPEDSISLDYHIEAGYIAWALGQYPLSAEIYKEIIEIHPKNDHLPFIYLRLGAISNDDLGDTLSARKYYELLLKEYPTSEYAKGAETGLKTLGMDVDEQLKYILKQQETEQYTVTTETPVL